MKFLITLSLFLSALIGTSVLAQNLSPEQMAKLNALPPALRAQALAEFKKFQISQAPASQAPASRPVAQPQVVKPKTAPSNQKIESDFEAATDIVSTAERPVSKQTPKDLKQFGYDLFAGTPSTFAPATEIPVPTDYIIGPGDQIRIQFFGKGTVSYDLYVTREGILQVPELGPISVAGQLFTELKREIARRVSQEMIGIEAFVSLGELRSIRVFILGDVNRPGSYTVSALSTLTNALFVSGGISPIGSLRNIQLKRAGKVVSEFDLYDLLLRGDTSKDVRIQPGDVIFVPPVGTLVGISGEVKRPAIYELKEESTASESIDMAGGFTAKAYPSLSQIERITDDGIKEVLDLDLTKGADGSISLKNGDVIKIYSSLERAENVVTLTGMVERPGVYQWSDGMKLTDVIKNMDAVLPSADIRYVVIERQIQHSGRITVFSTNLMDALENPNAKANSILHAKDRILIFNDDRIRYRSELRGIIAKLRNQANFDHPAEVVTISGSVRHPGNFPLEADMRIRDLLRAAGDFTPNAYVLYSIVERIDPVTGHISVFSADLRDALNNPLSKDNHKLQSNDRIYVLNDESNSYQATIRQIVQRLRSQANFDHPAEVVTISGSVRHPGNFPLEADMRISDLLRAAGDFTPNAYVLYSIVERIDPVTGHISVFSADLRDALNNPLSKDNHKLQSNDRIYVLNDESNSYQATIRQIVQRLRSQANSEQPEAIIRISGKVRHPGEYPLEPEMEVSDLIQAAGGFSQDAYTLEAELLRFVDNDKEQRETLLVPMNLGGPTNSASNLHLQSFDQVLIKRIPEWNARETISIGGEVRFPGTYTIERGESLNHVIQRAGGLTDLAHPDAAVFMRESLRQAEAVQIARLRERLKEDVSVAKLQEGITSSDSISTAEQLLGQLENTQATGRLVIDLPNILAGNPSSRVTIKGGDRLMIPQKPQSVTIIGSVSYATSHFYQDDLRQDDYINLSGGLLKQADKKQIYIVRSNGRIKMNTRSRFFPHGSLEIRPGDTIVVPVDIDRMRPLKFWGEISQIVFQLALGAAAVNAF